MERIKQDAQGFFFFGFIVVPDQVFGDPGMTHPGLFLLIFSEPVIGHSVKPGGKSPTIIVPVQIPEDVDKDGLSQIPGA